MTIKRAWIQPAIRVVKHGGGAMNKTDISIGLGFAAGLYSWLAATGRIGDSLTGRFFSAGGWQVGLAGAALFTAEGIVFGLSAYRLLQIFESKRSLIAEKPAPIASYVLPPLPKQKVKLQWILGEEHVLEGGIRGGLEFVSNPGWFSMTEKGLYTGVFVLGAIGSAKSSGVARPLLRQVIRHNANQNHIKPMVYACDYKAELVQPVREECEAAGRVNDLYLIGPAHDVKWNPVWQPEIEPETLAARLFACIENVKTSPGDDPEFIKNWAFKLFEASICFFRLTRKDQYFTLFDIATLLSTISQILAEAEAAGDSKGQALNHYFLQECERTEVNLQDENVKEDWEYAIEYFRAFSAESDKWRPSYTDTCNQLLNRFRQPRIRRLYCAPKDELNFIGFSSAIDTGKVVCLDFTYEKYGAAALLVGTALKLEFQTAAKSRQEMARDNPNFNMERPCLFLIDEYQAFVSSGGGQGDDAFFNLCRSAKVMSVMLTQSLSQLTKTLGKERTAAILSSLRTHVFLALSSPEDQRYASEMCGQEWRSVRSTSIVESVQAARVSGGGDLLGDETTVQHSVNLNTQQLPIYDSTYFRDLPMLTAVVSATDGFKQLAVTTVRLKPYYAPFDETYAVSIAKLQEEEDQLAEVEVEDNDHV